MDHIGHLQISDPNFMLTFATEIDKADTGLNPLSQDSASQTELNSTGKDFVIYNASNIIIKVYISIDCVYI